MYISVYSPQSVLAPIRTSPVSIPRYTGVLKVYQGPKFAQKAPKKGLFAVAFQAILPPFGRILLNFGPHTAFNTPVYRGILTGDVRMGPKTLCVEYTPIYTGIPAPRSQKPLKNRKTAYKVLKKRLITYLIGHFPDFLRFLGSVGR